jgi:hypothetical protein
MSGAGPDLTVSPASSTSTSTHESFDIDYMIPDDQCKDYRTVFPGEWKDSDEDGLEQPGWAARTEEEKAAWKPTWVPYWTRPNWDPSIEVSMDGSKKRTRRGDLENFMRPAILEHDESIPRTKYTRFVCQVPFPDTYLCV